MPQSTLAIVILICILISFVLNKIPLGVTAILGAVAMAAFGIISYTDAISSFGSDSVMLVVGMVAIGSTMFETGFAQILGAKIVSIKGVGTNEKAFLVILLVIAATLSAFTSNTATTAMLLPLISSVAYSSKGKITKKNTYMAVGMAAVAGGNATLAGSTPQLVAQGVLMQTEGCRGLSFFELLPGALPVIVLLIVYFVTIGYRLQKKVFTFDEIEVSQAEAVGAQISERRKHKVWISALIFVGCVICFVLGVAPMGIIAITGACLCCITKCITPKRIFATMDWSSVAILGGALGFAKGVEKSGAIQLVATKILGMFGDHGASPMIIAAIIVLICAVLSNIMSHTATAAIMTPLAIALAQTLGVNPITFVIMVVISCGMSFTTPMSTPCTTMTLSAGYRFTDYVIVGGILNILAIITVIFTVPLIYGL